MKRGVIYSVRIVYKTVFIGRNTLEHVVNIVAIAGGKLF